MTTKRSFSHGKMLLKKTKYKMDLQPGEHLDDLLIQDMKIIQHDQQFKFSLDAVLLAHFAMLKPKDKVADLGTGTGVIALLMAARGAAAVEGFEINPIMTDMARRSVLYNGLENRIVMRAMDLRKIKAEVLAGGFDLVVSNPPYRSIQAGKISFHDDIAIARHEILANLQDVVHAAKHLLKFKGRFAMVHLPERIAEIIVTMHQANIEPKRMRMVQGTLDKKPTMVLIEGVVGAKPGIDVAQSLIIYKQDRTYSDEVLKYYQK